MPPFRNCRSADALAPTRDCLALPELSPDLDFRGTGGSIDLFGQGLQSQEAPLRLWIEAGSIPALPPHSAKLGLFPVQLGTKARIGPFTLRVSRSKRAASRDPSCAYTKLSPAVSPDGRWIAYQSNETGRSQIYVRPFPDVENAKWQVSPSGGAWPVWSPDGRELFYQDGPSMMAVSVETAGMFSAAPPKILSEGEYVRDGRNFDITPDGRRFIMLKEPGKALGPSARDQLTVVLNWFDELRQLAPAAR